MFTENPKMAIIGAGKIAYSITGALTDAGYEILSVFSRSKESAKKLAEKFGIKNYSDDFSGIPSGTNFYILSVPDDQIEEAALKLSCLPLNFNELLFIHLSGSLNISVLNSLEKKKAYTASVHIMQTFPSKEKVHVKNCYAAVETNDKDSNEFLFSFTRKLGMIPFAVSSEKKVFYHAAGVMASNFLIANLYNSLKTFEFAETGQEFNNIFFPIIEQTLMNAGKNGVMNALSGPVERGDLQTIRKHIDAIKIGSPDDKEILNFYIRQSLTLIKMIKERDGGHYVNSKVEEYLRKMLSSAD